MTRFNLQDRVYRERDPDRHATVIGVDEGRVEIRYDDTPDDTYYVFPDAARLRLLQPRCEVKPTIGRIVHYHQPNFRDRIVTSPAIITRVDHERSIVNLTVFLDEETPKGRGKTLHARGVPQCETPTPYAWSWPPRDGS